MQRLSAALGAAAALVIAAGCTTREPVLAQHAATAAIAPSLELADVPFFPQDDFQCGPAALATVLAYSGQVTSPVTLASRMYLPERRGSLQVELVATARTQQRIPYVLPPTMDALLGELNAGRPVIVLQNLGLESVPIWHFAVVIGYSVPDETFVLRSGTERRKLEQSTDFGSRWSLGRQWAMVVLRPGELPAGNDASRYLRSVADVEAVHGAAGLASAYRAALVKWPDDRVARFGLANALDADGQLAAAEREYRVLLEQSPDDLAPLNNLADILRRSGCRSRALATIDRALAGAAATHPLRSVLERTRNEILQMPESDAASC